MKNQIKAHIRQNLIDAFWKLYCEKALENITVKDITNTAGYNRGTFYEYFRDVYDVLDHIEKSIIPSFDELPPISLNSKSNGMPNKAFFELFEKSSEFYFILLGDRGDPAFASKLKNSLKPMISQEFMRKSDIDLEELDFILEYLLSAMIGIMSYWFKQNEKYPKEKLLILMNKLMEQGITKQLS